MKVIVLGRSGTVAANDRQIIGDWRQKTGIRQEMDQQNRQAAAENRHGYALSHLCPFRAASVNARRRDFLHTTLPGSRVLRVSSDALKRGSG
jgi:hypothetical protein